MTKTGFVFIMPCHRPICWFFAFILLTGCSPESAKKQVAVPLSPQQQLVTRPLLDSSLPTPNTNTKNTGNTASAHLLNTERLIEVGEHKTALMEINSVVFADLSSAERSKYNLLEAEIALNSDDAAHALLMLETAKPKFLTQPDQIKYYQSLSRAHDQLGNTLPAVTARIRLIGIDQEPKQRQQNIFSILDILQSLPVETLNSYNSLYDELSSWMALAKILKLHTLPGVDINQQLQQWQLRFPGHPASPAILQAYLNPKPADQPAAAETTTNQAGIAVLLPETGAHAMAGKAISEGLQAAYKQASASAAQPLLKFYNSEAGNIADIYQQAVAEGAVQVIGPLIKEQIQVLAALPQLDIPVLALNHVENLSKANLYQFGLSPIDEAEQLVLKARNDGRQTAVLLTPNNSQGQRIASYLTTVWQNNGGIVTGSQSYDPKQHDFNAVLSVLLGSKALPGNQPPAQTVLLSANPELGRELAPQLKYHQTGNLAIYAMPNIFSGHLDPVLDADLGMISFCDMPWLLDNFGGPLSQTALGNTWQTTGDSQIRLRALGIDAFNLLSRLNQLAATPYAGVTGLLALNDENRITRKLVCAQFKGGVPVVTGPAE
jgi:outer membrane PBP1 activator LpoA protein